MWRFDCPIKLRGTGQASNVLLVGAVEGRKVVVVVVVMMMGREHGGYVPVED